MHNVHVWGGDVHRDLTGKRCEFPHLKVPVDSQETEVCWRRNSIDTHKNTVSCPPLAVYWQERWQIKSALGETERCRIAVAKDKKW